MVLEKVLCQIDTYKQRTKSSSASSSSGGRSRLGSVNDNLFLENGEKSPNLGDDGSNVFWIEKSIANAKSEKCVGSRISWKKWFGIGNNPEWTQNLKDEVYVLEKKLQKLKLFIYLDKSTEKGN